MTLILGLTGYLGCGKSTAGKIFQNLGAHFISADCVVHELYKPEKSGYKKITKFFGKTFLNPDQTLNRKRLAKAVFKDRKTLKKLEKLIHPLVYESIKKNIKTNKDKPVIIIESIKWPKKNLHKLIDGLILVECDNKNIYIRNKNRYNQTEIKNRRRHQLLPKKIDHVLKNNGSIKDFERKIKKLYKKVSQ